MSWATPAEATALTGQTITQEELNMAQSILELWTGDIDEERMPRVKNRDARLLKKAVIYQAAWMQSKPALFERSDVDLVIQESLQFTKADQDTHVLAPLAKTAIMQLSWRRSRTIDPLTPDQALAIRGKRTAETHGKSRSGPGGSSWEPM